MARINNDIFKLSGSLGGMTFSQDELGTIARKKPEGPYKLTKGTRDGNMEMGGASRAVKALRWTLNSKKRGFEDQYFSGRLSGIMRRVVALGEGVPGQRKLDIRKNGGVLENFEFRRARPLVYSVGGIKEKPTLNSERTEIYWSTPTLNRKEQITAPEKATHFKFILGAGTVSNYEYSPAKNKYLPLEPKFRNVCRFIDSEPIALNQKTIVPVTLSAKLTEGIAVPEAVAVVSVVGIVFFRNVNGELLEVKDSLAMRVLGVG